MKIHDCQQGTEEWHRLRLGIPTASEFSRIVTPTGKLSSQADGYMHWLLAEWITGAPLESPETQWMAHGTEFEAQAAASFEFETELETSTVGFVTTDDGMIGASPDRLVMGFPRGVELKCPSPQVHVGYMMTRSIDQKYWPQVQGQIYVCEFEKVYLQSYCPGLPTVIVEVDRDEDYIATLRDALAKFTDNLLAARSYLEQRFGPFQRIAPERSVPIPAQSTPEQKAEKAAANAAWYEHLKSNGVRVPERI